jgi:bifunctional non-homologous end joining protein LigD
MPRTEASFTIDGHELRLSNLDKVLYPDTGFTKGQVIDYLAKIAPVLLPHLKDRPLTMKRYPNGVNGEFFYEKRAPKYRPSWTKTALVTGGRDPAGIDYLIVNDLASLTWVANLADLELHPFLAKKQNVNCPTQIMFDLDPGEPADVTDCAQVALWIRDLLHGLGLKCWVKCSGSKGLQLHIPLNTPTSYDVTKPFAKALAMAVTAAHPDRVVYDMKKAIRGGKVLIDWSQNDESKTTICVYSLRAKSKPFVAAPLQWSEVEACLKKDDPKLVFFGPDEVLARVKKHGDLFAEVLTLKQKLPKGAAEALDVLAQQPTEDKESAAVKKQSPKSSAKKAAAPPARRSAEKETANKAKLNADENSSSAAGSLVRYKAKRDFKVTAEPAGEVEKSPTSQAALFVIQKHDASHLHYDFRLAMAGVLKSWAVPKGIPTAHGEKHLAVEVEDHPMSYARFEGIIPPGQYGGGTVMVWDIGEYQMLGGQPLEAWKQGMMHMRFSGKKMKGEWTLIRTRQQGGKNQWLLLKSGKEDAAISAKQDDTSALSGRSLAQIARDKDKQWQSNRTQQSEPIEPEAHEVETKARPTSVTAPPASRAQKMLANHFVEPMKCLPVKEIPEGDEWLYELKFDGYRSLAIVRGGEALLLSRNKKSFNERFPQIVEAVAKLKVKDAVLDGEVVALDENNRPTFQLLQNYEEGPLAYYFFDLLSLDGENWKDRPLHERKVRLEKLLKGAKPPLFFSADLPGSTAAIWKQIQKQKLEGIIAKRRDSEYEAGRRSGAWAKIKAINVQEFVIGGYSEPQGARSHFGALLIGFYEGKKLHFCAKVGTGFPNKLLASLHAQMQKLRVAKCPFDNLPTPRAGRWGGGVTAGEMKKCTWVEPKLVCEVEFTEWTGDFSLRHPAFIGLREDVKPHDVHREVPVEIPAA